MINQLDFNGGNVQSVASLNGVLYIGGLFSKVNGQTRYNVAAVDLTTGELLPFAPIFDAPVYAVEACGSKVAFGGIFSHVNLIAIGKAVLYDPSLDTFSAAFGLSGYSFFDLIIPTVIFSLGYHTASDTLYIGGQFGINNGTNTLGQLAAVNVTDGSVKPFNLGFPLNFSIPSLSQTQSRCISIDQVNHRLYTICGPYPNVMRSFSIVDPNNISLFTWAPTTLPAGAITKIFYLSPFVYVSSYTTSVNGVTQGFIATNAVTGANDLTQDIAVSKQAFQGDVRVNAAAKSGNYLYVAGHFTNVKSGSSTARSCFCLFDLGNNANVLGENIDMSKYINIHYTSDFQSLQPSSVTSMFLDGDRVHLFGNFLAIDGTAWTNGHYILGANGKRIQTKYIF